MSRLSLIALVFALILPAVQSGRGAEPALTGIKLKDIDGKDRTLGEFKGKVWLVVNVASECGLTTQYAGLEELHKKYKDRGFTVLGFPCNDFGGQEPGSAKEIKQFCQSRYQVTFPLFEKIKIAGQDKHPLYGQLTGKSSPFPGEVGWNFAKFLVGRDGKILQRFDPDVEPDSEELTRAVAAAVAAK